MRVLIGARQEARQAFEKGRALQPDSDEAAKQIHYARDVAMILRENVVQGKVVDGDADKYSKPISCL
jgi:hypothetical protein